MSAKVRGWDKKKMVGGTWDSTSALVFLSMPPFRPFVFLFFSLIPSIISK